MRYILGLQCSKMSMSTGTSIRCTLGGKIFHYVTFLSNTVLGQNKKKQNGMVLKILLTEGARVYHRARGFIILRETWWVGTAITRTRWMMKRTEDTEEVRPLLDACMTMREAVSMMRGRIWALDTRDTSLRVPAIQGRNIPHLYWIFVNIRRLIKWFRYNRGRREHVSRRDRTWDITLYEEDEEFNA